MKSKGICRRLGQWEYEHRSGNKRVLRLKRSLKKLQDTLECRKSKKK